MSPTPTSSPSATPGQAPEHTPLPMTHTPGGSSDETVTLTVVYDNNRHDERLQTAWGFACWIEIGGTEILFDTGGDGPTLLGNLAILGLDPQAIDIVVLSHAHNDHTGGLQGLLGVNDHLVVYLPRSFPEAFKAGVRDRARVVEVDGPLQIIDRAWSLGEMGTSPIEQSLILQTRQGAILVTGCAHPGIVSIAQAARDMGPIHLVLGGFHLRDMGEAQIRSILTQLQALDIDLMAPCHCTGDLARQLFAQAYGAAYLPAGVGSVFTFAP